MNNAAQRTSQRSATHELTPSASCEDRGRQAFVFHTKRALGRIGATRLAGIAPESDVVTVQRALQTSPGFAAWSALNEGSQRQMWEALANMIDRQSESLEQTGSAIDAREKRGSLHLDPAFEIPEHLKNTAFHGQPGGYVATRGPLDLRAGVLQEAGGALYSRGAGTGASDSKAQAVVAFLKERFASFTPRKVLDLGCGFAGQTAGYAAAYADAEVHGIDVGAAALRFGHLRAESMGIALHLRQGDASKAPYDDGTFDLIVSNILLHEVPSPMLESIMAECHRLLRPGGIAIHQDVPTQRDDLPPLQKALSSWQTKHNDEPYWDDFAHTKVPAKLINAGFNEDRVFESYVPQVDGPLTWYFVGAQA